jgi:hypothetical protein
MLKQAIAAQVTPASVAQLSYTGAVSAGLEIKRSNLATGKYFFLDLQFSVDITTPLEH